MAAPQPQRKKFRPIRSCLPCRSRRIKCDQLNPVCTNCVKARRSCHHSPPSEPRGAKPSVSATRSKRPNLNRSRSGSDMGFMHQSSGGRTEYFEPSFWVTSGKTGPELDQSFEHQMFANLDPLSLYEGCSRMHYCTGSEVSAFALFQQEAMEHERLQTLGHVINRLPSREVCEDLLRTFFATIYPLIPILHLPTMYRQLDQFWIGVEQYHADGLPGGFLAECPSYLALVVSMLFCGTFHKYDSQQQLYMPSTSKTNREARLARGLYRAIMHTLALLGFPGNATIFSLAAYVIWNIPLIREESERSTSFTCTAFRAGQKLGLHRDPAHFQMEYWEAEVRRRTWWHIIHKDALSSTASGLPQMLWNQRQHDTAMVCESRDTNHGGTNGLTLVSSALPAQGLDEVTATQPVRVNETFGCKDFRSLNESTADCRQVVSVGRFLVTNTIRQILGRQVEGQRWSAQDVQQFQILIEEMSTQVKGRIRKLSVSEADSTGNPESLTIDIATTEWGGTADQQSNINAWGLRSTSQSRVFIAWSKRLLALMIEKANCVLYQPLLSDKMLWPQFRETAISHFHSYAEQYVSLCIEPSYAPFHWMYPGNYQPLQAVSVLLADLLALPSSPEAPTSRLLIDSVFSLHQGENGVVAVDNGRVQQRNLSDGDKRAWTMLRRFRHTVWNKMGIDPNMLWTCARGRSNVTNDSSVDEGSPGEDARRNSDAMPYASTEYSATAGSLPAMQPVQSVKDPFGLAFDENFAIDNIFDSAFEDFQRNSFLAFRSNEDDEMMLETREVGIQLN